jgi:hypothetical protein
MSSYIVAMYLMFLLLFGICCHHTSAANGTKVDEWFADEADSTSVDGGFFGRDFF